MGVYHLMGLGQSVGAVTGPLSYLAYRYQRNNDEDRDFFSRSGERKHRAEHQRVGDIQVIILFTTREIISGALPTFEYIENPDGRTAQGPFVKGGEMQKTLAGALKKVPVSYTHLTLPTKRIV